MWKNAHRRFEGYVPKAVCFENEPGAARGLVTGGHATYFFRSFGTFIMELWRILCMLHSIL